MICFHFTIFVVLETTVAACAHPWLQLWFAFILLSLSYWKQLCSPTLSPAVSCDLLSFYYLCRTGNNLIIKLTECKLLWFAFILLSLSYWKQRSPPPAIQGTGCDLLSFYYLCRTGNNVSRLYPARILVVICFHFTIFVVLETTACFTPYGYEWVVICFHFTIFVVLETTIFLWRLLSCLLWFAFILLSLSYWKQPWFCSCFTVNSCDLLSFYYLCRTGNNQRKEQYRLTGVVICFHFTIFVVLETTPNSTSYEDITLWFAFILLSLSYWKQQFPFFSIVQLVVICFHFTIFVVLETTAYNDIHT